MLPVIALVGRPNVGKSTLFNFLTRTRDALVADCRADARPQLRLRQDREIPYLVVDTGALSSTRGVEVPMAQQALRRRRSRSRAVPRRCA
jgi:GTP-binding protein